MKTILAVLVLWAAPRLPQESTLERIEREVAAVIEKVRPSVVQVTVRFGDAQLPAQSLTFSGVVYTQDGYIVTDAGGVEQAVEIKVKAGERTLPARHVASDRRSGVAVLHVPAADLTPAALAEGPARPGAFTIAVGNSFGAPGASSVGTVSGVDRSIVVGGRRYESMIQMSTPVQPGDCGGFVADSSGRLLGLVHSVFALDSAEEGGFNFLHLFGKDARDLRPAGPVSFATPAGTVKFAADRIIKHRRMVRGWLGVVARPLDEALATQLGLDHGAEIVRVEPESPARKARLNSRDILLEFDGRPVRDLEALRKRIAEIEKPEKVKVVYLRNRERREAEVELELEP